MIGADIWWAGRVFILLVFLPRIFGWGKEGHYAICKIAQGYLSEDADAGVKSLLPDYAEELAAVCSWADESRLKTPFLLSEGDCHDTAGHKDRCVTGAIYNYTMQLMTGLNVSDSENKYNLTEALLFLSHFIGDVHQPLHVGFIGDEGGNTITVHWYRRKTNLHHVWDTMIIESALKDYYNSDLMTMIQAIQQNITHDWSDDISSWENCNSTVCPDPYASESINLACKFAYRNASPGSTLGDEYFNSRLPVVEKRLAQSGIRLASVLNRIFSSKLSIAEQ